MVRVNLRFVLNETEWQLPDLGEMAISPCKTHCLMNQFDSRQLSCTRVNYWIHRRNDPQGYADESLIAAAQPIKKLMTQKSPASGSQLTLCPFSNSNLLSPTPAIPSQLLRRQSQSCLPSTSRHVPGLISSPSSRIVARESTFKSLSNHPAPALMKTRPFSTSHIPRLTSSIATTRITAQMSSSMLMRTPTGLHSARIFRVPMASRSTSSACTAIRTLTRRT